MSNSSQKSHRLLSRLYKDLNELQNNPYPGVAVFTDDADLRKLCLVLTPPSGPWKDMSLHFDVCLPEGWVCFSSFSFFSERIIHTEYSQTTHLKLKTASVVLTTQTCLVLSSAVTCSNWPISLKMDILEGEYIFKSSLRCRLPTLNDIDIHPP